ncbi:MAG: hypothetical protein ABW168_08280 [Sedimenticola sp.]
MLMVLTAGCSTQVERTDLVTIESTVSDSIETPSANPREDWIEATGKAVMGSSDTRITVRSLAYMHAEENLQRKGGEVLLERRLTTRHGVTDEDVRRLRSRVRLRQVSVLQDELVGDYYNVTLRGLVDVLLPDVLREPVIEQQRVIEQKTPRPVQTVLSKVPVRRVQIPSKPATSAPKRERVHSVSGVKTIKHAVVQSYQSAEPQLIAPERRIKKNKYEICLVGFPYRLSDRVIPVLKQLKGCSDITENDTTACYALYFTGSRKEIIRYLSDYLRARPNRYQEFDIKKTSDANRLKLIFNGGM